MTQFEGIIKKRNQVVLPGDEEGDLQHLMTFQK